MIDRDCSECFVKDLQKFQRKMDRIMTERLPEEMREPLLEAKRQMRLALRGLIGHLLGERKVCNEKHSVKSRCIKLE